MTELDLSARRLVICLGPGGVGKTTISAALGLRGALSGRDTDLMTIDPAPRLLDVLGIGDDKGNLRLIELRAISATAGRLRAMRLEPKQVFDELVGRYAPSDAARDAILAGRIYRSLSEALAGVADYMAMEQMLALYESGESGLLVLDTPPASDAIAFLGAPQRMLNLLNSRAAALLGATRGVLRAPRAVFDLAARAVLAAFDRISGLHLLSDVHEFVRSFEGMYEGFAARAGKIHELLRDPATAIVLITTAEADRVEQAAGFVRELEQMDLVIDLLVINRLLPESPDRAELRGVRLSPALINKLERTTAELDELKRREERGLLRLIDMVGSRIPIFGVNEFDFQSQSLTDLAKIGGSFHRLSFPTRD